MGRKNKAQATPVKKELDAEVRARVEAKLKQGDAAASLQKLQEAHSAYGDALKELPDRHAMAAEAHASKAAVYVMEKKWKEAVKECNTALDVDSSCIRALERRSRARFELGFYKDALGDIVKVNATAARNEASTQHEERVRAAVQGGRGNSSAVAAAAAAQGGSPSKAVGAAAAAKTPGREHTASILKSAGQQFTCKVILEPERGENGKAGKAEIKFVHVPYGASYYVLQKEIRAKWPNLQNFKIFFQDGDSDHVLITCQRDVQRAQQEALAYAHRVYSGRSKPNETSPTIRLRIEKCHRSDVPPPPKEEVPPKEQTAKVVVKSTDPHAEETVIELDEWLIDFANLWRDMMGIDPDKHVDLQTEGTEKCNRALDAVVRLPEAQELLEEAKDRFRDVTCMGLSNWANVHTCVAKKLAEHAAEEGRGCDNIRTEFDAACAEAIKRYEQALEFNDANVEALLGIGQVQIEQARFAAGILLPAVDGVESDAYKEYDQDELEEMTRAQGRDSNAKLREVLAKVSKEAVEKTAPLWDAVYATFQKAEAAAAGSKAEKTEERESARAALVCSPPQPDETHLMANQVKIMWGNALYDQSQIWGGVGLSGWKEMVTDAQARFVAATCKDLDVVDAMRNHICAGELELPLAAKPAPPAAAAAEAAAPVPDAAPPAAAKPRAESNNMKGGLPALKSKKGKGKAAK